jgi:hypothetical protein
VQPRNDVNVRRLMCGEGYNIVVPGRTVDDTETTRAAAKKPATPLAPRPGSPHSKKLAPRQSHLQHNLFCTRPSVTPLTHFGKPTLRSRAHRPLYRSHARSNRHTVLPICRYTRFPLLFQRQKPHTRNKESSVRSPAVGERRTFSFCTRPRPASRPAL